VVTWVCAGWPSFEREWASLQFRDTHRAEVAGRAKAVSQVLSDGNPDCRCVTARV
jgi:hypothetical protein